MVKKTRTIVTIAITVIALATIGGGLQGAAREAGKPREPVNQPDCWTGDVVNDWDRCDFLALNPERE